MPQGLQHALSKVQVHVLLAGGDGLHRLKKRAQRLGRAMVDVRLARGIHNGVPSRKVGRSGDGQAVLLLKFPHGTGRLRAEDAVGNDGCGLPGMALQQAQH